MKTKVLLFMSVLLWTVFSYAQNPSWVMAPKYLKYDTSGYVQQLSLPTGSGGYQGQVAKCSQNIQMDASGNILFFIVDGKIYGKNGELIDEMRNSDY